MKPRRTDVEPRKRQVCLSGDAGRRQRLPGGDGGASGRRLRRDDDMRGARSTGWLGRPLDRGCSWARPQRDGRRCEHLKGSLAALLAALLAGSHRGWCYVHGSGSGRWAPHRSVYGHRRTRATSSADLRLGDQAAERIAACSTHSAGILPLPARQWTHRSSRTDYRSRRGRIETGVGDRQRRRRHRNPAERTEAVKAILSAVKAAVTPPGWGPAEWSVRNASYFHLGRLDLYSDAGATTRNTEAS